MTPAEHAARIREALNEGMRFAANDLSEFPRQNDDGTWVGYEEVEQPFQDALASLVVLEAQAAELVAARQALQRAHDDLELKTFTDDDGCVGVAVPDTEAIRARIAEALAGVVVPAHSEEQYDHAADFWRRAHSEETP